MLPKTADIVVVGSGAMGLSTAYQLVKKGFTNVVILERDALAGGHSTGRCAGGFRHQFATRINVELSQLSLKMLADFPAELECQFEMDYCGYLFALTAQDDIPAFENSVRLQQELGIATQWLDSAAIGKMLPQIRLDNVVGGTFYAQDGLVEVGGVIQGWLAALERRGVRVLKANPVVDIGVHNGRIAYVDTNQGRIHTPVVVNAAGPWASRLGAMVGVDLPVKPVAQQLLLLGQIPWVTRDFPVVIFPAEGLGLHREGNGLLTGLHREEAGVCEAPEVDPEWENRHCEQLLQRVPGLEDAEIASSWAGLYEMTPDLHPILGSVPEVEGFFCINGFSGHGFMHSPACGLLLSEEIIDGRAHSLDIASLHIGRFGKEKGQTEFYRI